MLDAATKVFDSLKLIREITRKIENAELHSHVAELISSVADLKLEVAEAKETLAHAQNEIANLKIAKNIRNNIRFDDWGLIYLINGQTGYSGGPYCPICFEKDNQLMQARVRGDDAGWSCICCKRFARY